MIRQKLSHKLLLLRTNFLRTSFLVLGSIGMVGCSGIPYAVIDASHPSRTDVNVHGVTITGVDGQMYFDADSTRNVKPGLHQIRLTSNKASRTGNRKEDRVWEVDAKPCKRYLVQARHDKEKRFSHKFWDVELIRVEDIAGCKVPENYKTES